MRLYAFRRTDTGALSGYPGHVNMWVNRDDCLQYCYAVPGFVVQYEATEIGPDAPRWRELPTCDGLWMQHATSEVIRFRPDDINARVADRGPWWFGPIPPVPEVTQ